MASLADALVAIGRITKFLTADELAEPFAIDTGEGNKLAVDVDGDFAWETAGKPVDKLAKGGAGGHRKEKKDKPKAVKEAKVDKKGFWKRKSGKEEVLPTTAPDLEKKDEEKVEENDNEEEKPFELKNLKMKIPKGSFVAIVGRVGSGKVGHTVLDGFSWLLTSSAEFITSSYHRRDATHEGKRGLYTPLIGCICIDDAHRSLSVGLSHMYHRLPGFAMPPSARMSCSASQTTRTSKLSVGGRNLFS